MQSSNAARPSIDDLRIYVRVAQRRISCIMQCTCKMEKRMYCLWTKTYAQGCTMLSAGKKLSKGRYCVVVLANDVTQRLWRSMAAGKLVFPAGRRSSDATLPTFLLYRQWRRPLVDALPRCGHAGRIATKFPVCGRPSVHCSADLLVGPLRSIGD